MVTVVSCVFNLFDTPYDHKLTFWSERMLLKKICRNMLMCGYSEKTLPEMNIFKLNATPTQLQRLCILFIPDLSPFLQNTRE